MCWLFKLISLYNVFVCFFFFSSRRRHTRYWRDWSSDVCSSDLIEIAIEPKSKADQEKLGVALAKMVAEDPSFTVQTDQESGQTIMKGMGELHLDIKVDILKRTYKVEANIGAPQVAYRESLGRKADIDYTHKKQTGGTGQFARITVVLDRK